MPGSRQLKRRILKQAVVHNLEHDRLGAAREGAPARRRLALAAAALALVLAASAAVVLLRSSSSPRAAPTGIAGPPAAPGLAPPQPAPTGAERPVERVVLDPGHGGDDTGAVVADEVEKDLTLDIARRLRAGLEEAGFEAFLTRDLDRHLSLRQRAETANGLGADLFVSIHLSRIDDEERQGIETFFLGATEDAELQDLARRENHGSGFSVADLRRLLEGIYAHPWRRRSEHLAACVQRSLYRSLLPVDPTLRDLGARPAPFAVLVATDMPAIVAEVSCLSTRHDSHLLGKERYRDHIARALLRGIESYARTPPKHVGEDAEP